MDPTGIERLNARVPRYTSYPTAPRFHEGVTADDLTARLRGLGAGDRLSLYLHVPFCFRMCWYCGCHTRVVARYDPVAEYARCLGVEIDRIAGEVPPGPRVSHIHWGGGTPTSLTGTDFSALMDRLRRRFAVDDGAEIAVEIDPCTLNRDHLAALAGAGVNRVSLGVQDFDPVVQQAINRTQPFAVTAAAVDGLREAGIAGLSMDLMYGLPHQTVAGVVGAAERAVSLGPDRLAVFGYAHVPWMKAHQRMIDEAALPSPADRFRQAEAIAGRLVDLGYRRVGLDHFARPEDPLARALAAGTLRRNFQGYTTDAADALIGFGASAISGFDDASFQNAVPVRDWQAAVDGGRPAVARGCLLDADDRLRRAVIERLMCDMAVDLDAVGARFGVGAGDFAAEREALGPAVREGIVEIDGPRIRIPEAARPLVRTVAAVFDRYLEDSTARHAPAV